MLISCAYSFHIFRDPIFSALHGKYIKNYRKLHKQKKHLLLEIDKNNSVEPTNNYRNATDYFKKAVHNYRKTIENI